MTLRKSTAPQVNGATEPKHDLRLGTTGSGLLLGMMGLTITALAAVATWMVLVPGGLDPGYETGPIGNRLEAEGAAARTPTATPPSRETNARGNATQPDLLAVVTSVSQGLGSSQGAETRPMPPGRPPSSASSVAFEDAPGVLSVSLRTRRKDALRAYPTEALGAIALGLEDLRLTPTNADGRISVNLGEQIRYEQKEHEVPKMSRRLLDGIGRLLAENPDIRVEILAHTDDEGDAGFNLRLSQRRAEAIKEYLVGRGVPRDRIIALGRGEEAPLIDPGRRSATRAERAKNRRTELVIEPVDSIEDGRVEKVRGAEGPNTVTAVNGAQRE